jgi:hypothetical protein
LKIAKGYLCRLKKEAENVSNTMWKKYTRWWNGPTEGISGVSFSDIEMNANLSLSTMV